jgi:AcrR family transcriptional regulator
LIGQYVFYRTVCQAKESTIAAGMSKRRYRQQARAETAEATRQRILDALYELLRDRPAEPVSVEEVAQHARVSRSTVYLAFGSRSGLFDALTERLLLGPGNERIEEAVRHPDARETLRGGLEGGVRMYAAHHDVLRVLYAAGKLDPDGAGRAIARSERRRYESMGWVADRLAEQDQLSPNVPRERAAHVIWLLASFDAYDLLVARGLELEDVTRILTETAEQALLAPPRS